MEATEQAKPSNWERLFKGIAIFLSLAGLATILFLYFPDQMNRLVAVLDFINP